jgi:hypothetical protein
LSWNNAEADYENHNLDIIYDKEETSRVGMYIGLCLSPGNKSTQINKYIYVYL